MLLENLVREILEDKKTHREYDPASPIDEIKLCQSIKELHDEGFFPYDSCKAVRWLSRRLSEARNHERMACGFWVRRAGIER